MSDNKTKRAPQDGKLRRQLEAPKSDDAGTIDHTAHESQRLNNIADLDAPLKRLDRCADAAHTSAVTMAGISTSDAEELLVQVWLLLEKHQVASPEVAVKSLSHRLQIRLRFTLKEDADFVGSKLEDWAVKRGLRVH
jgi:hypothetical protein